MIGSALKSSVAAVCDRQTVNVPEAGTALTERRYRCKTTVETSSSERALWFRGACARQP